MYRLKYLSAGTWYQTNRILATLAEARAEAAWLTWFGYVTRVRIVEVNHVEDRQRLDRALCGGVPR